jgi:hypothetical protein
MIALRAVACAYVFPKPVRYGIPAATWSRVWFSSMIRTMCLIVADGSGGGGG